MNFLIVLILALISTEAQFSFIMRFYCKKNKGVCKNCLCWSCPRKKYIDEYKISKNGGG